jgi:hypothetical protein
MIPHGNVRRLAIDRISQGTLLHRWSFIMGSPLLDVVYASIPNAGSFQVILQERIAK